MFITRDLRLALNSECLWEDLGDGGLQSGCIRVAAKTGVWRASAGAVWKPSQGVDLLALVDDSLDQRHGLVDRPSRLRVDRPDRSSTPRAYQLRSLQFRGRRMMSIPTKAGSCRLTEDIEQASLTWRSAAAGTSGPALSNVEWHSAMAESPPGEVRL